MVNAGIILLCLLSTLIFSRIGWLIWTKNDTRKLQEPFKLIVISFDGFRYDYLNPELTPNLYGLAQQGVTGHMLSTFATKTFPNHHSISTGLYQESHGIVHNGMFDPEFGECFDRDDGCSDRWWDNHLATPLYIANQLFDKSRSSCCAPWIGCHVRYFGKYKAHYHRHYNRSSTFENQLEWALNCMTSPYNPANLVMIYVHEPDLTGHLSGPFGEDTLAQVRRIDRFIGFMMSKLNERGLQSSLNMLILSDHGLSEISPKRVIVLDSFLNSSWYEAYGCNPVYHVRPRPGCQRVLEKALRQRQANGGFRFFAKAHIPARFRYRSHRRILEYLVLANEGWSVHHSESQLEKECHHKGQHGYDNQAQSMRPLFLALGPSFKQAYRHSEVFTNVDLYPLMLHLLGIEPNYFYHEGNFTLVRHMLKH